MSNQRDLRVQPNVDVVGRYAVVSDRGLDRIRVYRIDPCGLTEVTVPNPPLAFSGERPQVEGMVVDRVDDVL